MCIRDRFIRCGISSEKLIPTGIPIREDFLHANNKEETKVRFGLHPYAPHLLIRGGSMGCGPMKYLVRQISKAMPKDCAVTVICGTNRKLRAQLDRDYAEDHRVVIRGFVEDVSAMMDSADPVSYTHLAAEPFPGDGRLLETADQSRSPAGQTALRNL